MKAQVFTLDLIVGLAIIITILTAAYYITGAYESNLQATTSNTNAESYVTSAITAFADSSMTISKIDTLQVSGASTNYFYSTLNEEIPYPYYIEILADENYGSAALPSTEIYTYQSSGFNPQRSIYSVSKLVVVYNSSNACTDCNASMVAGSGFPQENITVNAQKCTILTPSGTNVLSEGWTIYNNTPSGECTVTIGPYADAPPTSYLVKGYSGAGTYLGNTTLRVMSLDAITVKVSV